MNEDNIIELAKKISIPSSFIKKGIDDDTAVVITDKETYQLFTSDMLIEGTHFTLETITPYCLGWKSLAVNLSDIASMGGVGRGFLLSIGLLPDKLPDNWTEDFFRGLNDCSVKYSTPLIGGDTVKSANTVINIALWGDSRNPVYRTGIENDYAILITGEPGLAAAGLWLSDKELKNMKKYEKIMNAFHMPQPQITEGQIIASLNHVAMMDSSDGLVRSLEVMCEQNNLGAVIDKEALPVSSELKELSQIAGIEEYYWPLYGGEDYILIVAAPPDEYEELKQKLQKTGTPVYRVGYFTRDQKGVNILDKREIKKLESKYFKHF